MVALKIKLHLKIDDFLKLIAEEWVDTMGVGSILQVDPGRATRRASILL